MRPIIALLCLFALGCYSSKLNDPLLDAAEDYFEHLDESKNGPCKLAAVSFVRSLRSGQGWDYGVREATRAVDAAVEKGLSSLGESFVGLSPSCLSAMDAFESALKEEEDPVSPSLRAFLDPLSESDPCAKGGVAAIDALNDGRGVTEAFKAGMESLVMWSMQPTAVPTTSCSKAGMR